MKKFKYWNSFFLSAKSQTLRIFMIKQKEITLPPFSRGFHNIDRYIVDALSPFPETGMINIFCKHTSAGLMINENADPDVMVDLTTLLERSAPENDPAYIHTMEGPDDMPSHFKSAILGHTLTVPITKGRMNLGIWQSVFFCEFRNRARSRQIVLTVYS